MSTDALHVIFGEEPVGVVPARPVGLLGAVLSV